MKHLFIVTQCLYTLNGIECILREIDADVKIHPVKSPWDIMKSLSQGLSARECAVLVALPSLNARARTHALWFAWAFHRLLCEYIPLQVISRFILAEASEIPPACRFWTRISPRSSVANFKNIMMSATQFHSVRYYPANAYKLRITPREREVLECIMNGATDKKLAKDLCISKGVLSTFRYSLTNKLGLKSRFDFAWLHGMEFR